MKHPFRAATKSFMGIYITAAAFGAAEKCKWAILVRPSRKISYLPSEFKVQRSLKATQAIYERLAVDSTLIAWMLLINRIVKTLDKLTYLISVNYVVGLMERNLCWKLNMKLIPQSIHPAHIFGQNQILSFKKKNISLIIW